MFYIIVSFTYWLNLINIWLREEESGLEIKRVRVAIKQTSRIRVHVYWTASNLSCRFCLLLLYFKAFGLFSSLYPVLVTSWQKVFVEPARPRLSVRRDKPDKRRARKSCSLPTLRSFFLLRSFPLLTPPPPNTKVRKISRHFGAISSLAFWVSPLTW